ncbi:junctional sarcoplasmic reticulum protein 1 isoform X2 [Carettochelys insculpta]|uniref:junctional sarcoplasmic reticulum protein 1 isoform X2 n=2 Tax=Carettochelys insculpta TaxID=44489 RepID=UPI003EC09A8A
MCVSGGVTLQILDLSMFVKSPRRHEARIPGADMATGACEVLERDLECPEAREELPVLGESVPRLSNAEVPQSEEEVNSLHETDGWEEEEEERNTLHVIENDLAEFVESMTDTPVVMETTVMREETVAEEASYGPPQAPTPLPAKRKAEPRTIGPTKEKTLWEGLTLNKCLLIATFVALLSLGFQVFQDVIDAEDELLEAEPRLWAQPKGRLPEDEDSTAERGELWFFKSWLSWLEPEEAEEPEARVEGTQQDSPARAELSKGLGKLKALEKMEEKPQESAAAQLARGDEKEPRLEGKASKGHGAQPAASDQEEEEGEELQRSSKRAHGKGKEGKRWDGKQRGERPRQDEGKSRQPRPDSKPQRPSRKEPQQGGESWKRASKQQQGEHKGRKPGEQHTPFVPKFKEDKRHN